MRISYRRNQVRPEREGRTKLRQGGHRVSVGKEGGGGRAHPRQPGGCTRAEDPAGCFLFSRARPPGCFPLGSGAGMERYINPYLKLLFQALETEVFYRRHVGSCSRSKPDRNWREQEQRPGRPERDHGWLGKLVILRDTRWRVGGLATGRQIRRAKKKGLFLPIAFALSFCLLPQEYPQNEGEREELRPSEGRWREGREGREKGEKALVSLPQSQRPE